MRFNFSLRHEFYKLTLIWNSYGSSENSRKFVKFMSKLQFIYQILL